MERAHCSSGHSLDTRAHLRRRAPAHMSHCHHIRHCRCRALCRSRLRKPSWLNSRLRPSNHLDFRRIPLDWLRYTFDCLGIRHRHACIHNRWYTITAFNTGKRIITVVIGRTAATLTFNLALILGIAKFTDRAGFARVTRIVTDIFSVASLNSRVLHDSLRAFSEVGTGL